MNVIETLGRILVVMKYVKGKVVKGTVSCIESYGAFMTFDEYYTGLIHISEISNGFVKDIHDFLNIGDNIYVQILDVDEELSHLKLSIKNINYKINGKPRRKKIIETSHGFNTLNKKLPIWISQQLKKTKKEVNSIDK